MKRTILCGALSTLDKAALRDNAPLLSVASSCAPVPSLTNLDASKTLSLEGQLGLTTGAYPLLHAARRFHLAPSQPTSRDE